MGRRLAWGSGEHCAHQTHLPHAFAEANAYCSDDDPTLLKTTVDVVAPQPGQQACDSACGTSGFLLVAHDYLANNFVLDKAQNSKLKSGTFFGIELAA